MSGIWGPCQEILLVFRPRVQGPHSLCHRVCNRAVFATNSPQTWPFAEVMSLDKVYVTEASARDRRQHSFVIQTALR